VKIFSQKITLTFLLRIALMSGSSLCCYGSRRKHGCF